MDITQFVKRFSTEEACFDFIEAAMWEEIQCCPICKAKAGTPIDKSRSVKNPKWIRFRCQQCYSKYSSVTGAFFGRTKIPVPRWLLILYVIHLRHSFITEVSSLATLAGVPCLESVTRFLSRLKEALTKDPSYLQRLFRQIRITTPVAQIENIDVLIETPRVIFETNKKEDKMSAPENNEASGDLQLCDNQNKSVPVLSASRNLYIKKISWEDICALEELVNKIKSSYIEG